MLCMDCIFLFTLETISISGVEYQATHSVSQPNIHYNSSGARSWIRVQPLRHLQISDLTLRLFQAFKANLISLSLSNMIKHGAKLSFWYCQRIPPSNFMIVFVIMNNAHFIALFFNFALHGDTWWIKPSIIHQLHCVQVNEYVKKDLCSKYDLRNHSHYSVSWFETPETMRDIEQKKTLLNTFPWQSVNILKRICHNSQNSLFSGKTGDDLFSKNSFTNTHVVCCFVSSRFQLLIWIQSHGS